MAVCAFLAIHVAGVLQHVRDQRQRGLAPGGAAIVGFVMYWYNFVPHVPGVAGVVLFPFLFVLELIGAVVKPFALAIRLFANMMAGHIILKVVVSFSVAAAGMGAAWATLGVFPVLINVGLMMFELLVACIQAYVFAILSCVYLKDSVDLHH